MLDQTSRAVLRARLLLEEGIRFKAYWDQFGYPTQGVGHKLSSVPYEDLSQYPDIDQATAMAWLDADIDAADQGLETLLPWVGSLDGLRAGVLVDMAFQMGTHGVMGFPHMLAACENGDYAQAAMQMRNSLWARQTPGRADALAQIMETGAVS